MEQLKLLTEIMVVVAVGCVAYTVLSFVGWIIRLFGGYCVGCNPMEIKGINKQQEDSQAEIGHNGRRPTQKEIRECAIKQILENLEVSNDNPENMQVRRDRPSQDG